MIFSVGFAVRSGITDHSGDHRRRTGAKCRPRPGSHSDTPQDRTAAAAPTIRPTIQTCISVPTRKHDGSGRNGAKRTLGYKIKPNGFARPDEARTRKVSSTRSTRAPANPDALRGHHRDRIMRTTARHQPLRAREKRGGRLFSKRCFRIAQCLCHDATPPDSPGWPEQDVQLAMAAIRQNLQRAAPHPANTGNRITRPLKPLCPL